MTDITKLRCDIYAAIGVLREAKRDVIARFSPAAGGPAGPERAGWFEVDNDLADMIEECQRLRGEIAAATDITPAVK
jgi:hypothetical protein